MKRYTLTIGMERDAQGYALSPRVDVPFCLELIGIFITRRYGGFTRTEHLGGYRHAYGTTVTEKSVSFSVLDFKRVGVGKMKDIAEKAKRWLKQESVLLVVEEVKASLI